MYIGSQHFSVRDMSKSFIGQDFKYNEFENKLKDNSYIITNQIVEKVVLGDIKNTLRLYKKGLTIQNIPTLNNLNYIFLNKKSIRLRNLLKTIKIPILILIFMCKN
ncbi:hypothetical protein ACFIJ5_13630 [Haloimpatiens sp. FM7330]|uniref:hypothetical protein n=1 Tax=Haloimpatiens sp. FM7330 TaxID=3298610 RepID=UPI003640CD9F